jgi:hypothetical protein
MADLELPKWRLQANFLLRELVRMWYGESRMITLWYGHEKGSKLWERIVSILTDVAFSFGEEHGISPWKAAHRFRKASEEWQKRQGEPPTFGDPCQEAKWRITQMLDEELALKLFETSEVNMILDIAGRAYALASKGQTPPHEPFDGLRPLTYYEALPIDKTLEWIYRN